MKLLSLNKIALSCCVVAPICIAPQVISIAVSDSFETASKDEIPDDFYKIENGTLLGFNDNITQSDLYVGHYKIINIPSNVTEISDYAFSYMFDGISCDVSTLIIPQQLKKIGNYSFFRCSGLTDIVFRSVGEQTCSLQSIGAHCFEYCSFTGDLVLTDALEEVGDRAFYNCKSLDQKLVLPASLKKVGDFAFASCTNIHTIDLTKYETIPIWMYSYKSAFQAVGADFIGDKRVLVNTNLDSSDIWEDVIFTRQELYSSVATTQFNIFSTDFYKPIPEYKLNIVEGTEGEEKGLMILRGWKPGEEVDLSEYNVLSIPARVNKIGNWAFYNDSELTGKIINCELTLEIQGSFIEVGNFAFMGCTGLVGVDDWTKINSVGASAFAGCTNLAGTLNIEASTISALAFMDCYSLSAITLSPTTIDIQDGAFYGCDGVHILDLQNFEYDSLPGEGWYPIAEVKAFDEWNSNGVILLNPNNTRVNDWIELLSNIGLTIDDEHWGIINDEVVINQDEFIAYSHNKQNVRGFSSLGLNKITEFNTFAFQDRVETIADYAFKNTLTKLQYPNNEWTLNLNLGLQTIGKEAFRNNTGLRACFYWPNSLTKIDDLAFCGCSNMLGSFSLPRSLTYLGDNAFDGCQVLSSNYLVIPSTINYIGNSALRTVKVTELKLKKFSGTIKSFAFADNNNLAWINLTDYKLIPRDEWNLSSDSFNVSGGGSVIIDYNTSKEEWKEYLINHGLPEDKWDFVYPNEII